MPQATPTPASPLPLAHDDRAPDATSPQKTPLVLLHGFPLDRSVFADMLPHLTADRRVLTVDLPGFGASHYNAPFTLDDLAQHLRAFLQSRGLLPCILGGLSMGGYVTLAYYRLFPADLRGVILIDTKASADTTEAKENRNRMAEVALRPAAPEAAGGVSSVAAGGPPSAAAGGAPAIARMMQPKMLSDHTRRTRPDVEPRLMQIMLACPPATIASACLAMRDRPDYTPDLPRMTVPLLMITGAEDAIAPPDIGRSVASAAAQGTYAEIPHAGHLAPLEQPQATAEAINRWMQEKVNT